MPGFDFGEAAIDAYKAIPLHIRQIFAEYTPIIEPLSLDDVYERHSGNRSVEPEHIEQPTAQIVGHGYPPAGSRFGEETDCGLADDLMDGHRVRGVELSLGTICRCQTPFGGAILPSKPPGIW